MVLELENEILAFCMELGGGGGKELVGREVLSTLL